MRRIGKSISIIVGREWGHFSAFICDNICFQEEPCIYVGRRYQEPNAVIMFFGTSALQQRGTGYQEQPATVKATSMYHEGPPFKGNFISYDEYDETLATVYYFLHKKPHLLCYYYS